MLAFSGSKISPGLTVMVSGSASCAIRSLQFEFETSRVSRLCGLKKLLDGTCDGDIVTLSALSGNDEADSTGLIGSVELADDGAFDVVGEKGMVTARESGIPRRTVRRLEALSGGLSLLPKVAVSGEGEGDTVKTFTGSAGDGISCSGLEMMERLEGGDLGGGGRACDALKIAFDLEGRDASPRLRARLTPAAAKAARLADDEENSEKTGSPSMRFAPESRVRRGLSARLAGLVPSPSPDR